MTDQPTLTPLNHGDYVVNGVIALAGRLNLRPALAERATVECRYAPVDDEDLRSILVGFSDYFEFDPVEATLTRTLSATGDAVRIVIDVSQLALADVLAITDETRPAW